MAEVIMLTVCNVLHTVSKVYRRPMPYLVGPTAFTARSQIDMLWIV